MFCDAEEYHYGGGLVSDLIPFIGQIQPTMVFAFTCQLSPRVQYRLRLPSPGIMVSSLYTSLRDSVLALAQEHEQTQEVIEPAVQSAWQLVWSEYTGSQSSEGKERVEMVRNVMDLVGRDLVVSSIASGEVSRLLLSRSQQPDASSDA